MMTETQNTIFIEYSASESQSFQLFPRVSYEYCQNLADQWHSYCDADDLFCDAGRSIKVHLGYVERYRDDIVNFIVGKVQNVQQTSGIWDYRVKKNNDL